MKFKVWLLSKYSHLSQLGGALVILISLAALIVGSAIGSPERPSRGFHSESAEPTPVFVFHYTELSEEKSKL